MMQAVVLLLGTLAILAVAFENDWAAFALAGGVFVAVRFYG